MHRGKTRSNGAVHVYTVALARKDPKGTGAQADLVADVFVDGARRRRRRLDDARSDSFL